MRGSTTNSASLCAVNSPPLAVAYTYSANKATVSCLYKYHLSMWQVMLFSCIRVCPCILSVPITFESRDAGTSFLICRYTFSTYRSNSYFKVTGSTSRSQKQIRHTNITNTLIRWPTEPQTQQQCNYAYANNFICWLFLRTVNRT